MTGPQLRAARSETARKIRDARITLKVLEDSQAWLDTLTPDTLAECGRHRVGTCQPTTDGGRCKDLNWQHLPL